MSIRVAAEFDEADLWPLLKIAGGMLSLEGITPRDPIKVKSVSYDGLSFSFTCLVDGEEREFEMPRELELPLRASIGRRGGWK